MRRLRIILLCFVILLISPSAFAEEESKNKINLKTSDDSKVSSDFSNPLWMPGPETRLDFITPSPQWFQYQREFNKDDHSVVFETNSSSAPDDFDPSGELTAASIRSSVTYRYNGLFGGIVRPVGRFTVGSGQVWMPSGGQNFRGYTSDMLYYAMPEAGVEFVYKGVGVGMTAGYVLVLDAPDFGGDVTGPQRPWNQGPSALDWKNFMKNFYLIYER